MTQETPPNRILEVAPDDMTEAQKAGIEALLAGRGRLLMPYRIWLHSPELMRAMEQLGTFLNKRSSLTEREVELGICLAAHHWGGDYVSAAHERMCLDLGYPPSVIDAIREDRVPDLPNPREKAVYDIACLANQPGAGDDAVFESATAVLGRNGLAEVICLLGYYSAVAIGMKLHRVPPRQN